VSGGATLHEKVVEITGCPVHYVEQVPDEPGTPLHTVLYVHGNLGSCRWFSQSMEIPGARVIALDMPNFGRSGRIPTHDIPTYAGYVTEFIRTVARRPVVLVGHSLGGSVAMAVACANPPLVERMLLVDSAPVEGLVTPPEHYPAIDAYRQDEGQLRAALKTIAPTLGDEKLFDQLVSDARMMKAQAYVGHAEELGKADHRSVADHYAGHVLVIRGGQDWLVTSEMASRTAAAFNGTVEEFPSVGHSIMVEAPALFKTAVTRFLSGA
jgi:branched-chain amino acid transport system permease protein